MPVILPDTGARQLADYAIVAETTGFRLAWTQAGKAVLKVTIFGGPAVYAPFLKRPYTTLKNPNAIIRATTLVQKIEEWAYAYEKRHTHVSPGGTVIPTVNIGAIRGGVPFVTCTTPEVCSLYIDCRLAPNQDALALKGELEEINRSLGLEGEVEILHFRRGYEAEKIDRLAQAIGQAHKRVFHEGVKPVIGPECSMWRDDNVFKEAGIPAVNYGPGIYASSGIYAIALDDLHNAAQVYALTALDLCNQDKTD